LGVNCDPYPKLTDPSTPKLLRDLPHMPLWYDVQATVNLMIKLDDRNL